MKTLIYFNRPNCPENMGISQLTDNLQQFLSDRSDVIINPIINGNILKFENGYAILTEVPDNFEN